MIRITSFRKFSFFLITFAVKPGTAQTDSNTLHFLAYLETYYAYDFNRPTDDLRPWFLYNHNRHNEVNVNLALIHCNYNSERVRANIGLMAGTYAKYNLANEGALKIIYEANAGLKISRKKNLFVDAGVFPSHIGSEGIIGKNCLTLTRSLQAENSPYYETGVRASFLSTSSKHYIAFFVLNGWQRITLPKNNHPPSFGTQYTIRATKKILLNWSTFVGNDQPDSLFQWRFFNSAYVQYDINDYVAVLAGFDYGVQQLKQAYGNWYSPLLIIRLKSKGRWAMALRTEYYNDPREIIVQTDLADKFSVFGASANIDVTVFKYIAIRLEGRLLESEMPIFKSTSGPTTRNYCITSSVIISFSR